MRWSKPIRGAAENRSLRCADTSRLDLADCLLLGHRPLPPGEGDAPMTASLASTTGRQTVAVIGAGTMGAGIAYVFARAGWHVTVAEPSPPQRTRLLDTLKSASADGMRRGKLTEAQAALLISSVSLVTGAHELPRGLDLAIESVPEDLALKQSVLRALDERAPTIIGSNTSGLSIDALADCLADPTRLIGMHFFNPVWSLPLVELVVGGQTSLEVIDAARRHAESVGKQTIVVRNVPGFATSRLDLIASLEAIRMLEDGVASAEDIDRAAVLAYRHPIGPLRLSDIVGLDVRLDIARHLHSSLGERYAPPRLLEQKVARGELGQKSGKGFYDWPAPPSSLPTAHA